MFKGACPSGYLLSHKEYVIGGRFNTVNLFLNEILGRFEVLSKWSKSKEIRFMSLIRVRRFPGYWVRYVVLLSSSNKIQNLKPVFRA